MQALGRLYDKAVDVGFLSGFQVGNTGSWISHSLLVNDSSVLCGASHLRNPIFSVLFFFHFSVFPFQMT